MRATTITMIHSGGRISHGDNLLSSIALLCSTVFLSCGARRSFILKAAYIRFIGAILSYSHIFFFRLHRWTRHQIDNTNYIYTPYDATFPCLYSFKFSSRLSSCMFRNGHCSPLKLTAWRSQSTMCRWTLLRAVKFTLLYINDVPSYPYLYFLRSLILETSRGRSKCASANCVLPIGGPKIRQWYGHPIAEADVEIFQIEFRTHILYAEHSIFMCSMIPSCNVWSRLDIVLYIFDCCTCFQTDDRKRHVIKTLSPALSIVHIEVSFEARL
jgi:hypothetical protein